ncbi:MetQ/NlpA family ABC transporter substrate-binding protein [Collinsella ihumii]|uniref:Lipoprotein n=1 Tax=Collinsella ihumii TaxID=1720204 RepID=A0AAW7JUE7_9ACTN|nr:MetQ/NlpA family ABC transporter substrate-binding protein [Collinsella ihumii]MDN0056482.1 MetQ/NlpA family ABC transporter substrate-binding protein [Collinsella ihumii]MDN0064564.1 MetQ/NlpA family ABC transporter substrate-binding protein [Collinsella ihumii]MDN0070374.1 MetQ/NlpA family ABC transporter substrate-binding protein [Collinsella ihumii]
MLNNIALSRRSLIAAAAAVVGVGSLAACGTSGDTSAAGGSSAEGGSQTLTVAASPSPHAEILNDFAADKLAEQGIALEVKEYTDYILPNQDVSAGEIDCNYFQHINYLNNYNEENGTDLVNVGKIHFEPMGVFAGKSDDLANIADGATISVPNDATNEGRALLLLQEHGVITLSESAGITATPNDIVDNPHNVEILEQEAAMLPSTLADVDFAVINGNYAIDAGLTLADAVAQESADSDVIKNEYANVIVTRPELEDDERIKALVDVLTTDEFKEYLADTFGDSVQAAF